jgi:DUF438 domain-containing protein
MPEGFMPARNALFSFFDSINLPIVFVDNDHVIRYLNKGAEDRYYRERGYTDLVGRPLLDCHNLESAQEIVRLYERLKDGEDEISFENAEKHERFTVVAIRDDHGKLAGYYECVERTDE